MIELRDISKHYEGVTVYEHFDLSIEEGKITCLLGGSGCGKTTLLNILAGTVRHGGSVEPRTDCSYIFQTPRLVPNLTVEGNLRLVCKDREWVASMLARVGLSDKARAYPVELSGGQAQRVSIARAFLRPSGLLLMDEPFSSLDTALKIRLMDVFCQLWREERRTAVFVTHDAEEAYMLAHRAIVLRNGRIAADFSEESAVPRAFGAASPFKEKILRALLSEE